jgi:hypothetical protein
MIYRRFVNEEDLLKEYETDRYYRQFTLGELINQENINAKFNEEKSATTSRAGDMRQVPRRDRGYALLVVADL